MNCCAIIEILSQNLIGHILLLPLLHHLCLVKRPRLASLAGKLYKNCISGLRVGPTGDNYHSECVAILSKSTSSYQVSGFGIFCSVFLALKTVDTSWMVTLTALTPPSHSPSWRLGHLKCIGLLLASLDISI